MRSNTRFTVRLNVRSAVRLVTVAFASFAGACSIASDNPAADSPRATTPSATTDSAPTGGAGGAAGWTVTANGIGAVRVGMAADDLRQAAGDFAAPTSTECAYVHPASAPAGVLVMLANGQVARIDVDSAGVRTDAGVAVGDSSAAVSRAYDGRVTTTPHKYVPTGEYLTVRPASPGDSSVRIVFESENGRVARYRVGRVPEVEWVERCG